MITLNQLEIRPTRFPDNTTQVWKIPEEVLTKDPALVKWRFQDMGELVELAQIKDLLDQHECRADLLIEYLPFGRQDKRIDNKKTFALWSFSKLLNAIGFDRVYCIDPHSHVAANLIDNFIAIYPKKQVDDLLRIYKYDFYCYPDQGAMEKYKSVYPRVPFVHGIKTRDESTGRILDYQLRGDVWGKTVLIVDDICDGGATFERVSEALLFNGAKEIDLFVSHGIFSKGLGPLLKSGIRHIFTKQGQVSEVQGNLCYKPIAVEVSDEQYLANASL